MAKRPRGTGSIYSRPGTQILWIKYYDLNGRAQCESTGTSNRREAEKILDQRRLTMAGGNSLGAREKQITVAELIEDVIRHHRLAGNASVDHEAMRWREHLAPFFGRLRAAQLTSPLIDKYIEHRQGQEIVKTTKSKEHGEWVVTRKPLAGQFPSNGTINRELALLRSACFYANESTPRKLATVPKFNLLAESAPRTGFLKDEEYQRLAAAATEEGLCYRAILAVLYNFGWRKGELLQNMRVRQIDLSARTITLEVGTTKNDDGRVVRMTSEVFTLLTACVLGKGQDDFVFTREDGSPVHDMRVRWARITAKAGVPDLMLHDMRRSGARNLRRLGVAESVIMKIGGWKTRSVFERYNIIDQSDIADAAARLDAKAAVQTEQQPEAETLRPN